MGVAQWLLNRRASGWFLGLLIFGAGLSTAFAGDSFHGKVTSVRSAEVMVLDYGHGRYVVRLFGIDAPKEGPPAAEAKRFVEKLVLDQEARARFEGRKKGEMVSRLFTGDPGVDIGLELVRAGLARRLRTLDYKYGELAAAEEDARKAGRGIWATPQPK